MLDRISALLAATATDTAPFLPGAVSDAGTVIPVDAAHGITTTIANGDSVGISIPAQGAARQLADGTVAYDGSHLGTQVVVDNVPASEADGLGASVRTQVVIDRETAPMRYSFATALPADVSLEQQASGEVYAVDGAGQVVGLFGKPWALDAAGKSIPTKYEVEGNTLVQVVDHVGATYPVTADPWWFVALAVAGRPVTHKVAVRATTRAAARKAAIAKAQRQGYTVKETYMPVQGNFFTAGGFTIRWYAEFYRANGFSSFRAFKNRYPGRDGYEWHHIVEQANVTRFGTYNINNKQNLILIRSGLHRRCVNAFMNTRLKNFTKAELDAIGIRRTYSTREWTLRQAMTGYSLRNLHTFGLRLLSMCGVKIA